ncbi:glycosyltransferase involved in cell wall biosynthesis [Paenibacillus sp. LBL]|uniref:glycosyltransferase n=1 Tax=Paenibacillus sp. LBL TaxID=2940563 RepID=UPI002477110A|nr:glycosyltransferase [Paenibacillus sp. LBL]MDH6674551.1 glycosyltransferase involved in cell wall biosynthesis [Paenibacillus sp. LBL]
MNIDFYFVDDINFNKKNLGNFLRFTESKYRYYYNTAFPRLKTMQGNYQLKNISGLKNFKKYEEIFASVTLNNYKGFTYKGYIIWDIVKAELKRYLIPRVYSIDQRFSFSNEKEDSGRINKLLSQNATDQSLSELLINNYCVAAFWIDYWAAEFNKRKPANVCVFGGTTIYSRSATLVAQWRNLNVISFEGTFLKKFHYADNASGIITNNHSYSNRSEWVKLKSLVLTNEQELWLQQEMEKKTNINVVQPSVISKEDIYSSYNINPERKIVLLVGQVIDDYSLTYDLNIYESSIEFYKRVVDFFQLNKKYHLFIKLHPWEKRNNEDGITKIVLINYIKENKYNNVTIEYDVNIDSLIEVSEFGITACSQAGIEMLYSGKRVVQAGNAFYGYKGWTIDVTHKKLLEHSIRLAMEEPKLTHIEAIEVKKFLYHLLHNHCFTRNEMDSNFNKKFKNITVTNNTKSIYLNSRFISLLKKGVKNPRKAITHVRKKIIYRFDVSTSMLSSKKIVNMVMGELTKSKIFDDMLEKFKKNLGTDYRVVISKDSIPNAHVYQYWRPHRSAMDIKSPSIVTVHHDFLKDEESLSLRHFIDSYRAADIVVCLNENQKENLKKYGIENITIIPHGYEPSFKLNRTYKTKFDEETKLVIGFCSKRYERLVKGEELLYQIIDKLNGHPVKFIFIGEGRKMEYQYCSDLGIEAEVYENLDYSLYPNLYSKMDLFLITSKAEGGPASLPEAMISGLPVISTPCGFVPDFIVNGWNGFLLNEADDFAAQIIELINQPEKIETLGRNSINTTNLHTWDYIISEYTKVYSKLLST